MTHRGFRAHPHSGPASLSRHGSDCPPLGANTRRKQALRSPSDPEAQRSWGSGGAGLPQWGQGSLEPGFSCHSQEHSLTLGDRWATVAGMLPYRGRSDVPLSWRCILQCCLPIHTLFSLHCSHSTYHTWPSPGGALHTTSPSCIHPLRRSGLGHKEENQRLEEAQMLPAGYATVFMKMLGFFSNTQTDSIQGINLLEIKGNNSLLVGFLPFRFNLKLFLIRSQVSSWPQGTLSLQAGFFFFSPLCLEIALNHLSCCYIFIHYLLSVPCRRT